MPIGVDQRRKAHVVQPLPFLGSQDQLRRGEVVLELRLGATADNNGSDGLQADEPGKRNLGNGDASAVGNFDELVDNVPQSVFIADRRFLPTSELTATFWGCLVATMLA